MRNKLFKDEFYYFLDKFKKKENYTLLRFSDGELFLLQNKQILLTADRVSVEGVLDSRDGFYSDNTVLRPKYDQKTFTPSRHSEFRDYLIGSFLHNSDNYYKGISCRCCVGQDNFDWQIDQLGGDDDSLTWSNVLLNSNYPLFLTEFYPEIQKRGAYVVCSEEANLSHLAWVKKHFSVGVDIFDNFKEYVLSLKQFIKDNNIQNEVFLFSASSLSNVLQFELAQDFPNNTYIDIGTTLSHEFKVPVLRGYVMDYFNGNLNNLSTCIW
jgi:hypothetical protein